MLTKRLKGRWSKDLGLLMQNMKTYVSCNEGEGIWNYIVRCNPFPAIGITKKVSPYKI